jgi:predicted GIY-YIG superfamily endonuclease
MRDYYVYILSNYSGTLYAGVTTLSFRAKRGISPLP